MLLLLLRLRGNLARKIGLKKPDIFKCVLCVVCGGGGGSVICFQTPKDQRRNPANMDHQGKKAASLSSTRLSPLAKPFTFNRSTQQPNPSSSLLSPQQPSVLSLGCSDDPFSSLLDSFRKSNLDSKVEAVPVETALPVETSAQNMEKSLFEQHPSPEFGESGDFDGFRRWSHFEVMERPPMPTYSSSMSGLGYGTGVDENEVSYRKKGVDLNEILFGKGNDVGSSADDGSMLQNGNRAVDGLNPSLAVSDGIFKKSTTTIGVKDILSNSKGTIHTTDESSSFILSNYKVAPLKFLTDSSSAKNIPQSQSSKSTGDSSDSDVDSPCWKGTVAISPTPSETSGSVQFHHVEKVTEKHNSLNPLAPQFFPGIGYIKDDFVSSNSSAPVATNLFSGEDLLMKTFEAESPAELNRGIEVQHSTNICGREKSYNMLNDPKSSSVDPLLNSHCIMIQSSSKVDCSTSNGKLVTVVDVDGFVKGIKEDPRASGSKSGVFPAMGHSPTPSPSSSGVSVVTDLFETLKGFSKSFIESPKPDVHIMVSAINVLSELLVQTCVDGADSNNEPDCDMILQIINNLNVFSTKKLEQRIPALDSTHSDHPNCLDMSSELPKGLGVTSIETLPIPNQLYVQNHRGKSSVSKVFGESGQVSFVSSSHPNAQKGDEFAQLQIIRRSLGKKLDSEKQMHPEASLFWNLWLDSEAERCYRKFKTVRCLMEAGMDVNSTNIAELLR